MIAGDILLGAVFFADLLMGVDPGIDLFLLAFLGTDALLSLDYISRISKEERQKELEDLYRRRQPSMTAEQKLDREMAEDISGSSEALDYIDQMDPEELAELLQHHEEEQSHVRRR